MSAYALSRHACARAKQRGITSAMIDALIEHADVEAPAGGGCTVLRLSKDRLRDADLRAALGGSVDRLASLALVWSADEEKVVTVLRHHDGSRGRRYRRGR